MKLGFWSSVTSASLLLLAAAPLAQSNEQEGVIFDARVGAGAYYSDTGTDKMANPVVDISGALVIGDKNASNFGVDFAIGTALRDGGATVVGADVALRGRLLEKDSKFGFEGSIPFKYRKDDNYYEFSAFEVSAIMKVVDTGNQQVLAKIGFNPFTKRTYGNNYGSVTTSYDPVNAGSGFINQPSSATVYGAPDYQHDPDSDYTYNDNRNVYFGGGTMQRTVNTSFDTSEYSVRIPISIEYNYKSSGQKLVIKAVAYYSLRAGVDKLTQNDDYRDFYQGQVSYSNVHYDVCYDQAGNSYWCNPTNIQYAGDGQIVDRYRNATDLQSQGFIGQNFGGSVEATYSVYKSPAMELLLDAQGKAEVDTHVMDAVGEAHTSTHVMATGGAIVRF